MNIPALISPFIAHPQRALAACHTTPPYIGLAARCRTGPRSHAPLSEPAHSTPASPWTLSAREIPLPASQSLGSLPQTGGTSRETGQPRSKRSLPPPTHSCPPSASDTYSPLESEPSPPLAPDRCPLAASCCSFAHLISSVAPRTRGANDTIK